MSEGQRQRREEIVEARAESWRRRARSVAGRRAATLRAAAALRLAASSPQPARH